MNFNLKEFIPHLTHIILELGELAVTSQKTIVNIGKEHEDVLAHESEDERVRQRARAKTQIDVLVQEKLLKAIKDKLRTAGIKIDAEEDTPSKKLFTDANPTLTIVIDPIDGTLEYTQGSDRYSIVVGFIQDGKVIAALIYYPGKKKLYSLGFDHSLTLTTYDTSLSVTAEENISLPTWTDSHIIYVNNRVSQETVLRLESEHYTIVRDTGEVLWDEALLKCIAGEYHSCVFHTPQTRDVLFGAFIQNLPGGYMTDWEGEKIPWPNGGRIQRVKFGFSKEETGQPEASAK
jgi:fructose-1,6-bisphosphatase/inositol monophosphatase family enzyme